MVVKHVAMKKHNIHLLISTLFCTLSAVCSCGSHCSTYEFTDDYEHAIAQMGDMCEVSPLRALPVEKRLELARRYSSVLDCSEGFSRVYSNYKFGFVDNDGNEVIPCIYDYVDNFSCGVARVKNNGRWGFIDNCANEVVSLSYDYVLPFSDGLAPVYNEEKWGVVDKCGKELLPCVNDFVGAFPMVLLWSGPKADGGMLTKPVKTPSLAVMIMLMISKTVLRVCS